MGKLFTDVTVAQLSKTKNIQHVVFLNPKPWSGAMLHPPQRAGNRGGAS